MVHEIINRFLIACKCVAKHQRYGRRIIYRSQERRKIGVFDELTPIDAL